MKAIIEFNFPEDEEDYKIFSNALEYYSALHEIKEKVRAIHKYRELSEEEYKIVDEIYRVICEETLKFADI